MTGSRNYYVYEHWRLDRDECFYVGKGNGGRAFSMKNRNRHHQAIVSKLSRIGSAFEVRIVASGLSEKEAFSLERERIQFWRESGIDLTNITNGGEGTSGFHHSEETKRKLSEKNKGTTAFFKGRKHTEKTKLVLSELAKKRGAPQLTKEQQEKASAWHRGRKRSDETRAKISAKAKGRISPMKGKTSPLKGLKRSPEFCAKQSEAAKLRWQKRKMEGVE